MGVHTTDNGSCSHLSTSGSSTAEPNLSAAGSREETSWEHRMDKLHPKIFWKRIIKVASIWACIEDQNTDYYRGTRTPDHDNLRVEIKLNVHSGSSHTLKTC